MIAFEEAERFNADFEPWAVDVVKSEESYERDEGLTGSRDGPIGEEVELGLGGAVTVRGDVMTDILDTVGEKFAFL